MDERRRRKFFHFTEDDLAANQLGEFSEGQKKRLDKEAREERTSARESAAILFVIAAAGMAVGITIGSIAPSLAGRIAMYALMAILWPSVWAGKGIQIIRAANILQEPGLCEVTGPIQIVAHGEGEFTLQVGELEFDVDGNPSGTVMEGDEYTIYYVESTQEIFSVDDRIRSK